MVERENKNELYELAIYIYMSVCQFITKRQCDVIRILRCGDCLRGRRDPIAMYIRYTNISQEKKIGISICISTVTDRWYHVYIYIDIIPLILLYFKLIPGRKCKMNNSMGSNHYTTCRMVSQLSSEDLKRIFKKYDRDGDQLLRGTGA